MRASDEMRDAVGQVTRGDGTELERHLEQGGLNECMRVGIGSVGMTDLVHCSSRTYSETFEWSRTEVCHACIRRYLRVRTTVARRVLVVISRGASWEWCGSKFDIGYLCKTS